MQKFRLRYVFVVMIAVVLISLLAFIAWANNAQGPTREALVAMQSDSSVRVTTNEWLVFEPVNVAANTGFIFYPGGHVEPHSYAPYAHDIAAQGYLVVIVPVPLNLAFFNPNAAREVMTAYPEITHWAIGGHSLGGVAAAQFAGDNEDIQGLVFWASYPQQGVDLSEREDLVVASIYGTNDQLAHLATIEASRSALPDDAVFTAIEGGNHGQFGWYGEQSGDGEATISHEEQQRQTVTATIAVLREISEQ
jgi:hypothetical protein